MYPAIHTERNPPPKGNKLGALIFKIVQNHGTNEVKKKPHKVKYIKCRLDKEFISTLRKGILKYKPNSGIKNHIFPLKCPVKKHSIYFRTE